MYNWTIRRREKKKAKEIVIVMKTENFSKLMTDTKEERTPSKINTKKTTPRHTILKLQEILDKKKILRQIGSGKASHLERKKVNYRTLLTRNHAHKKSVV